MTNLLYQLGSPNRFDSQMIQGPVFTRTREAYCSVALAECVGRASWFARAINVWESRLQKNIISTSITYKSKLLNLTYLQLLNLVLVSSFLYFFLA